MGMTAFCTSEDITDKCGSTLASAILTRLATQATRKVTMMLKRENLSYTFGTVPDEIIEAAAHYGAALAIMRGMTDGKLPTSQSISGASASVAAQDAIAFHNAEGDRYMREYIQENGTDIDSEFNVVGREGRRAGEYEDMDEDLEEET